MSSSNDLERLIQLSADQLTFPPVDTFEGICQILIPSLLLPNYLSTGDLRELSEQQQISFSLTNGCSLCPDQKHQNNNTGKRLKK